jgi:MinD-like ATPase involved in chromosome partitioning or flagellar assembly
MIDTIRSTIESNMVAADLPILELLVTADRYRGVNIRLVSTSFEGMPDDARRAVALKGIDLSQLEWIDLLTPEEREWSAPLPLTFSSETLPLWPEALAKLDVGSPDSVATLEDTRIQAPLRATFYSLRGGVGRTTALAYTARILASRGRRVVCVDMDLEAPGLAALLGVEDQVGPDRGVVHALYDMDQRLPVDLSRHLIRVSEEAELYCMPAGLPSADYARRLRSLDPEAWYREDDNVFARFYGDLASNLPFVPDVILTDARTGITSINAPLLFHLSDVVMVVFFPHPQAKLGNAAISNALQRAETFRSVPGAAVSPDVRFVVSPVPAGRSGDAGKRLRNRALQWISEWLDVGRPGNAATVETDVSHFVGYRESVAFSDATDSNSEEWRPYHPIADWVESVLPAAIGSVPSITTASSRASVLEELNFSPGTAEEQSDFLSTFVETDLAKRALAPDVPLVLGRKGTGKTALFRRLAEGGQTNPIIVTAPSALRAQREWLLAAYGFKAVETVLGAARASWSEFWAVYTLVALRAADISDFVVNERLQPIFDTRTTSEVGTVELIQHAFSIPNVALYAADSLKKYDQVARAKLVLLFDGLDTGFGPSDDDRRRRQAALEGLFVFFADVADTLRNIKCKFLLREDLWRELRFENKSHFFGRSVALRWSDQAAFFRVALKQALRSEAFRALLPAHLETSSFDRWSDTDVFDAWNVLVAERMKGSKTAFTRNWVWNRLADANDDHSPRYLLQLMRLAVDYEKRSRGVGSDGSVIRPRTFIEVLPAVSDAALSALRDEEFPELQSFLQKLTQVGRTPVDWIDLRDVDQNSLNLAQEVGIIGVYEEGEEHVERYKVPELFRHGLKMTRKGQA